MFKYCFFHFRFWADILGVGDYYYELGVAIVHICLKTRHENGGIISVAEVVSAFHGSGVSSRNKTTVEDIQRAVQKLSVLGKCLLSPISLHYIASYSHTRREWIPDDHYPREVAHPVGTHGVEYGP